MSAFEHVLVDPNTGAQFDVNVLTLPTVPNQKVSLVDGANLDAAARLRVSEGRAVFADVLQYGLNTTYAWQSITASGGTVTHLPNESAADLTTTSTSGSSAKRITRQYFRYQPGTSHLIFCTFVLGAGVDKVTKRVGYYETNNGYYLEQNGITDVALVERTYVSGSVVNTRVVKSSWNIDKFDGTGPSGVTIDWTKTQILVIDAQWLGAGRVRVGFDIGGVIYYAHQFLHANVVATPYNTTMNLPIQYEISTAAAAAAGGTLKQICCSVQSEGGYSEDRAKRFSTSNGVTAIGVTTRRPILSIRNRLTFPGNGTASDAYTNRVYSILAAVSVLAASNSALVEVVYNGTLTGASFADVYASDSTMQADVAATSISGGIPVYTFYATAGTAPQRIETGQKLEDYLRFSLWPDGTTQDTISVVGTSMTGTTNLAATLDWHEHF